MGAVQLARFVRAAKRDDFTGQQGSFGCVGTSFCFASFCRAICWASMGLAGVLWLHLTEVLEKAQQGP